MHQPVEPDDGLGMALLGFVLGDQHGQRFFGLAGKNFSHALQPDLLNRSAGLAGAPGVIGRELGDEHGPIGLGEHCLVAEQWLDGVGAKLGDRIGPGRVDALLQRQGHARFNPRQG